MTAEPDWYKDCVLYELHVRAFRDGNGNGKGDFRGLLEKLPYLKKLGVDCLWLLPFYPSPLRDDGYDISDYLSVHPDHGTLDDFRAFLEEAHRLGMKVVTELVVNHTSDQHPWFQRARRAPDGSDDRNWYVWSDDPSRWSEARIIFTDTEASNWTWDPVAGRYFWHRFFSHQPDLNFDHPPVVEAIESVLRFWLDLGVDGMRLDAIPYLFERDGTNCENLPETHALIRRLRAVMDVYDPPRMFLAEANQWPEDVRAYFGDGDECHMAYHFPLMPRLFMALAQEDRHPVEEILRRTPGIPPSCQWAIFLRNHDELTLEMVTDKERDYMLRSYASNPRMRINVGIRRRLAPLLENSRPRIELLTSILLSMPGTPVLYYGDELGMGDNIWLGDRNGVRTPMQWSADRNAGFSSCDPSRLFAPPIQDPIYSYAAVNVEAQERDPSSLLAWTRRMLRLRASTRTFGRGSIEFLEPSNRRILAYVRRHEGETILVVANLGRHPQPTSLDLSAFQGMVPVEMTGEIPFPPIGRTPWPLFLGPWGWLWFRLAPSEKLSERGLAELPLLEAEEDAPWWTERSLRVRLGSEVLPAWLPGCDWVEGLGAGPLKDIRRVALEETGPGLVVASIEAGFANGSRRLLRVPLVTVTEDEAADLLARSPGSALARLRFPSGSLQVLVEALACPTGLEAVERLIAGGPADSGPLRTEPLRNVPASTLACVVAYRGRHHVAGLPGGGVLKWYHGASAGAERTLAVLRRLEERGFASAPKALVAVRDEASGEARALLLEHVENQGRLDARVRHELSTFLEAPTPPEGEETIDALLPTQVLFEDLAVSVAELHVGLGDPGSWPAHRRAACLGALQDLVARTAERLFPGREGRRLRERVWRRISDLSDRLSPEDWQGEAHGDLHLGQVLLRDGDLVFLDFDGNPVDPDTPLPAAYDLACLLVSLHAVAQEIPPGHEAERARWQARATAPLLQGLPFPGPLLELMLLRRLSERILLGAVHREPTVLAGYLDGSLPFPDPRIRNPSRNG